MKKALLIIDVQNDYFKGGAMELPGAEEACQKIKTVLEKCRERKIPIMYMQHVADKNASFFRPQTFGVEINDTVKPKKRDKIFQKSYPNSFRDTKLLKYLKKKKIRELIICGMMTHMCIDTSVRAAYDLGFNCTLIADGCATKNLEFENRVIPAKDVQASFLSALDSTFSNNVYSQYFKI